MAKIEMLWDHLDIRKDQCGMNEVSPKATAFISIFLGGGLRTLLLNSEHLLDPRLRSTNLGGRAS